MGAVAVQVGRSEGPSLDQGPLERYLAVFPDRRLRWNWPRQLWQIEQRDESGEWRRINFVCDIVEGCRRYRAFDDRWVSEQLREHERIRDEGGAGYVEALAARNEGRIRRLIRFTAGEMAAGYGEVRRWLPVLIGEKRVPLVPGTEFRKGKG